MANTDSSQNTSELMEVLVIDINTHCSGCGLSAPMTEAIFVFISHVIHVYLLLEEL